MEESTEKIYGRRYSHQAVRINMKLCLTNFRSDRKSKKKNVSRNKLVELNESRLSLTMFPGRPEPAQGGKICLFRKHK